MSIKASLKSSFVVALISGLAGLAMVVQDVVIANHFATGGSADAYQLAISFPLLAVNVFAGGTLLAVLVPLLTQYAIAERYAEAGLLIKQARRLLSWILFVVCGAWTLVYPHVAALVARGFTAETLALSVHLLWLVVPVLFFAGLAGVDAAVLNSRRRFVFISILPAFMPAGVIFSILLFEKKLGIYTAAMGLVGGGMLQYLACHHFAAQLAHRHKHPHAFVPALTRYARDYATAAASSALLAGILLTDTFMASAQSSGSTATFSYAVRPVILLQAFVTAVVGNVVLPFLSHMAANEDWPALKRYALFWFGLLALGSLPVVILWHAYTDEVVALLYQRGAFGASDTARVAAVQRVYLLQIPFFLVAVIGWRVMNSLNRHTALLRMTAMCFFANLATNLWLIPRLGLSGIAWGTNLAFALWAILIMTYLLRLNSNHVVIAAHNRAASPLTRIP